MIIDICPKVFYASLNFVGYYVRYVGEINMRRGFLDKRGCIDATFKLKYEKEQEVRKSQTFRGQGAPINKFKQIIP